MFFLLVSLPLRERSASLSGSSDIASDHCLVCLEFRNFLSFFLSFESEKGLFVYLFLLPSLSERTSEMILYRW